jgi:prephenate dehydrogenase
MSGLFRHIAIVGLGLIGGSIARAARERGLVGIITGYGRSAERLESARRLGLIDAWYTDCAQGIEQADLVFLGTPVSTIAEMARQVLPGMAPGAILTDVGSVKQPVVEAIEPLVPDGVHFIGGHPIAGTENSGFESALADLFDNRICVLTPGVRSEPGALDRLRGFWQQLGSRVIEMDVADHDRIFAAISHLPHMVAFALVNAIVAMEGFDTGILQYSAGGFRDFTRIAASDPLMWRDIAMMNAGNILEAIGSMERSLAELREALAAGSGDAIEAFFRASSEARRSI